MRLPIQSSGRRALQFNITPLIDIVFLLIIFFLVASHFVRSDNAEAVDLPEASAADPDEDPALRLTISILDDGSYSISGQAHSQDQVLQRIESLAAVAAAEGSAPEVRIRADRDQRVALIRPLIEHCARHSIRSIQFAVSVSES